MHWYEILAGTEYKWRNWVFATNSDLLISISLLHNVVDPEYFKLWIPVDQILYKRFTPSGCKDIGIRILSLLQKLNSISVYISVKSKIWLWMNGFTDLP